MKKSYKHLLKKVKNAELKNNYGYDKATSCGKQDITVQVTTTLFLTNMKE